MIQTILAIISHMVAFSAAMLPAILVFFYKHLSLKRSYDYQSILRLVTISILLVIVSVYKVSFIALYSQRSSSEVIPNVSLFFAIAFIVCTFLSIYFIIDRAIIHFKQKPKRLVLNIAAGVTILLAIVSIFLLVSQPQEKNLNYIDLAINFMYPTLTGVLSVAGIISLIFYKRTSKSQRIYSLIFVIAVPLWILDLFFAQQNYFLLTSLPYAVFALIVFIEIFRNCTMNADGKNIHGSSFKDEYDLTDREIEVYKLAAQGLSNQEISKKLFVSVHTVKSHLQHIFSKMNINTRYQLINFEKENEDTKK